MILSNIISIRIWSYTPTNKHWQDSLYNLRHNWDSIHSDIPVCPGPETAGSYIQAALFLHQDVAQHGHVSGGNIIILKSFPESIIPDTGQIDSPCSDGLHVLTSFNSAALNILLDSGT